MGALALLRIPTQDHLSGAPVPGVGKIHVAESRHKCIREFLTAYIDSLLTQLFHEVPAGR
jgi:chorismate mutase